MTKKIIILLNIIGLFLIFVSFFAGVSLQAIRNMKTNVGQINTQSWLLLFGCILSLPLFINSFFKVKRLDVKIVALVTSLILALQLIISIYFIFKHAGIKTNQEYYNIIYVTKKSFYIVAATMRYLLSLIFVPALGIFALFNTPSKKKINYSQIFGFTLFFASAVFLLMISVTCLKGMQQSLTVISRVADEANNTVVNISELRLYNICGISFQQVGLINDLRVGLISSGDITKLACNFANAILITYICCVGISICWSICQFIEELTKSGEDKACQN